MHSCLRSVIPQLGLIGRTTEQKVRFTAIWRSLDAAHSLAYLGNREFKRTRKMMVDTGATDSRGSNVSILPEKDGEGGYASGGWKRWVHDHLYCD